MLGQGVGKVGPPRPALHYERIPLHQGDPQVAVEDDFKDALVSERCKANWRTGRWVGGQMGCGE